MLIAIFKFFKNIRRLVLKARQMLVVGRLRKFL